MRCGQVPSWQAALSERAELRKSGRPASSTSVSSIKAKRLTCGRWALVRGWELYGPGRTPPAVSLTVAVPESHFFLFLLVHVQGARH